MSVCCAVRLTQSVRVKRLINSTRILLLNACRMSMLNSLRRINTICTCVRESEREKMNRKEIKSWFVHRKIFTFAFRSDTSIRLAQNISEIAIELITYMCFRVPCLECVQNVSQICEVLLSIYIYIDSINRANRSILIQFLSIRKFFFVCVYDNIIDIFQTIHWWKSWWWYKRYTIK